MDCDHIVSINKSAQYIIMWVGAERVMGNDEASECGNGLVAVSVEVALCLGVCFDRCCVVHACFRFTNKPLNYIRRYTFEQTHGPWIGDKGLRMWWSHIIPSKCAHWVANGLMLAPVHNCGYNVERAPGRTVAGSLHALICFTHVDCI